jgi:hypothetical protein
MVFEGSMRSWQGSALTRIRFVAIGEPPIKVLQTGQATKVVIHRAGRYRLRAQKPTRRTVFEPNFEPVEQGRAAVGLAGCCTSLGEQVASPRDELLDGLRGSAGDFLDRGGHAVIPILAM